MTHILHIEDEGYSRGAMPKEVKVPYCECGWLGKRVYSWENASQECREQFYNHLRELSPMKSLVERDGVLYEEEE